MKRPGSRPTVEVLPVLEGAAWPHRDRVMHTPLFDHPDSPIVAFAQGTIEGRAYVTADDTPGDLGALLDASRRTLAAAPHELGLLFRGVAGIIGRELSAERIVDPDFRAAVHALLGPEVWIAVPHRYAVFAVAVAAVREQRAAFATAVRYELSRAPDLGFAPVSPLAFRLVRGSIVAAATIDAIDTLPISTGLAPGIPHPAEIRKIDDRRQELNASILVIGTGAKQLARGIVDLGAIGAPTSTEVDGALEHACVTIGRIRGWTPRFYLYAFEPDALAAAEPLAAAVDAVIVTHRADDGWPAPEVAALAHAASAAGAVIAVVGPGRAAAALVGVDLDVIAAYDRDAPAGVFKAVAKRVLQRLYPP